MTATPRAYSPYALEAARLLGLRIGIARRERRWTEQELADRAGINRRTLRRIEVGDPRVAIGLAFEAATLTGVALFHEDPALVAGEAEAARTRLVLLPRQVRP